MTPSASARNQPMGTAHQIPTTPKNGTAERAYASATRVPSDTTVRTTDMPGFPSAR